MEATTTTATTDELVELWQQASDQFVASYGTSVERQTARQIIAGVIDTLETELLDRGLELEEQADGEFVWVQR